VRSGSTGLSNDQIVLFMVGVGAVVVLAAKRHILVAQLRAWLEARRVTLAGQEGLLSTPLGGFDVPRLLVAGGLVVLVAVVARFVLRRQRAAAESR
jgi:hypothetical protein